MAKKPTAPKGQPAPEVLPAVSPLTDNAELIETQSISSGLSSFLASLRPFFAKAAILENDARHRFERAKLLEMPRSVAEHEEIQRFARECRAGKAATVAHWEITKIAYRLHSCLTGARKRATDFDDAAFERANQLHNAYVAAEQRRVAEEERRRREEAERLERERREREAAELERAAVEAEAASPHLSARELAFVDGVMRRCGARFLDGPVDVTPAVLVTIAAAAGYKDAERQGPRLWASAKVQDAVRARVEAERVRQQAAAVKAAPVAVEVEAVRPELGRVASSATRWKARVTDKAALFEAVKAGAVPADVFMVDMVKLNEYARALKGALNNWPGVEATPDTRLR